jgi:hypothetical protein
MNVYTILPACVLSLATAMVSVNAGAQDSMHLYDADHSSARNWNEILLSGIRADYARPTVHARNLFHSSALMYDAWAVFSEGADLYVLGDSERSSQCTFTQSQRDNLRSANTDRNSAVSEAINYGVYTLLKQRFEFSPGVGLTYQRMYNMADALGMDRSFDDDDFSHGSAAAMGIYLANCLIDWGMNDGSNQVNDYANTYYSPINEPLNPAEAGSPGMTDPNRWQPLSLDIFVDQAGNLTGTPPFLGAEWGKVDPFAMEASDRTVYQRDGEDYVVYHDTGAPALLGPESSTSEEYLWGHSLVALWSAHLDPTDGVTIDISPASLGNGEALPETLAGLRDYYQTLSGGTHDLGRELNPVTGSAYVENVVLRGDYTRVLAEFWADGPDSETPPGHWFVLLNEFVSDSTFLEKRLEGQGEVLGDLEWDVKAYFILGGAMHDSAVSAWGIKGWYDYVRPVSALRYMASLGQSSDPGQDNYHPQGMPLYEGRIELVTSGDPLAGLADEHLGKVKIMAWRGPDRIADPEVDQAGVGWILAENWWPYQRPSFVTPPFAGYVSGHSTFSRAAADVLTALTGDDYFPGGLAEFTAEKNTFLVFEEGPSTDITLQWATYRDASDQTSLSRIWGGIHPPVDDIPGRRIGVEIAAAAFAKAKTLFEPEPPVQPAPAPAPVPNPSSSSNGGGGGGFDFLSLLVLVSFVSLLAACGGGGGGSSAAPSVPASGGSGGGQSTASAFVDVTVASGIDFTQGIQNPTPNSMPEMFSGGVAAGDYDNDGDIDLYIVRGDLASNILYQNDGAGLFTDVAVSAGVAETKVGGGVYRHSGPTFADMDGDGFLDLFIGAINGDPVKVYHNQGDGTFVDVTVASGLAAITKNFTISAAFGDYDGDDKIDLLLAHWGSRRDSENLADPQTLWRNTSSVGDIHFVSTSFASELAPAIGRRNSTQGVLAEESDYSFSPSFARMDGDEHPDILMTADFVNSQIFLNDGDSTFTEVTDESVLIDDSGMGSAVGDYDNDGDLDWFVTGIWGSNQIIGNRLYTNDGLANLTDNTFDLGVNDGGWAWAACFADFNLDGLLDLYHVNGWADDSINAFSTQGNRLFINNGNTFDELSETYGVNDTVQGRGLVCADFDNDGDVDLFITHYNSGNGGQLYRNDNVDNHQFLKVNLQGSNTNSEAAGARIYVTAGGTTQMREIVIGSNFTSQNPTTQIFGLGSSTQVERVRIEWPGGVEESFTNVAAGNVTYLQP